MKKIKCLFIVLCLMMVFGCGNKNDKVSELLVSEGAPKSNTSVSEGDYYYDKANDYLYQLRSSEWVLLGKVTNDKVENTCPKPEECKPEEIEKTIISISEDGYLVINGEKTESKMVGERGTRGDDGKDGKDGVSPTITVSEDGYVYINNIKLNLKEYKNGCYQTVDSDNDNQLDAGDEVKCGTEYFNVIYNNGTTVHMLAKYNLDVGSVYNNDTEVLTTMENPTGLQSSKSLGYNASSNYYGVVAFSEDYYWGNVKPIYGLSFPAYVYDSNSDIYNYLDNYKNKLNKMNSMVEKVRLIKLEEALSYICDEDDDKCDQSEYSWILNTSYWTGTADDVYNIYYISKDGAVDVAKSIESSKYGVRPVIEVLNENILK